MKRNVVSVEDLLETWACTLSWVLEIYHVSKIYQKLEHAHCHECWRSTMCRRFTRNLSMHIVVSVGDLPQTWVGARVENLPQTWPWALPWMLKSYHKPKQAHYHEDSLQKRENKNLQAGNEKKKTLQATQANKKKKKKKERDGRILEIVEIAKYSKKEERPPQNIKSSSSLREGKALISTERNNVSINMTEWGNLESSTQP